MTVANATKAQILEMAKKLPYGELWELIEELDAVLDPPPPGPLRTDEEFRAELDRRWEEYKSSKVQILTWGEVKAKARRQAGLPADE